MFCPNCGTILRDDVVFCIRCGCRITMIDNKGIPNVNYNLDEGLSIYKNIRNRFSIETLTPIEDGKTVCEKRKKIREEFAKKNGIELEKEPCTSDTGCYGTCPKCDYEAKALLKRVHPEIEDREEMASKGLINKNVLGHVFRVERLREDIDGPGFGTLIALDKCPLHCMYCLNYICHNDGKTLYSYNPIELAQELDNDAVYFLESHGGVTFGGGEPLLYPSFIHETCAAINLPYEKRIETSLNVPWENVEKVINDIDLWIIDIKDMNPDIYLEYTKCSIDKMRDNLEKLFERADKSRIRIRVPHIPGFNTDEDVNKSVSMLRDKYGIEPEVLTYTLPKPRNEAAFGDAPETCGYITRTPGPPPLAGVPAYIPPKEPETTPDKNGLGIFKWLKKKK